MVKARNPLKDTRLKKAIHPRSRKAAQVQRATHRDAQIATKKHQHQKVLKQRANRYKIVCDTAGKLFPGLNHLSLAQLAQVTQELITREQVAFKEFQKQTANKQHVNKSKQQQMEYKAKFLDAEFKSAGIEVPDLVDGKNYDRLKNWDGNIDRMNTIRTRKSKYSDLEAAQKKEAVNTMET
eukprot:Clim_evm27s119 gene=Clim_evmTU27s119